MADQEKDRQMDEMLDSLLANYSSAEPRPGLETRILANLREAEKKAPQGWWSFKWIWAGAVAAAIIIAAVLISGRHRVEPPTHMMVKTNCRNQRFSRTRRLRLRKRFGFIGANRERQSSRRMRRWH